MNDAADSSASSAEEIRLLLPPYRLTNGRQVSDPRLMVAAILWVWETGGVLAGDAGALRPKVAYR